ncbi:TonB-dependent receptor [Caulobacter vibrioides]|uniref:TonB-dependent receptor n=1 Tax=Caulobacter vibrioides TaxID=155892 RepID=UPI000BB4FEED|nr:TonB-dependent receptor [Caulobacter vibrioides]ATC23951.1 TonB-dependent receptor [Caulobacter vibrioides]AZH12190.1 TonB-dependent receptor [Caulobacter vibrioides]PLR15839.1 TonB-dependent receptor [Caulobacter vibrioides]
MFNRSKVALLRRASLLALSAVAISGVAHAADVVTDDQDAVSGVVVTARRPLAESQAAAMQIQKNSDSLISVLSADAIGDLPDQNIAFAVGRLPGVAIERDQGQARYVNLRGAPVYWTTLSFDGLSVVSPEGRATRFDNIPSAIASLITVEKAIVPSMPGDTVAGNVDIRTRRAFDYKGQKLTGKLGVGRVKLGGGDELDSNLVYSNVFGDKLGIVAQASYYSREMATDNWETDPYLSNTVAPEKRFAREHENKHYRLTRRNMSASIRADYKFDDNNSIFVSTINTYYNDDELRDNFIFRLDQGTDAAGNGYTSTAYVSANNPTSGTVFGARINARIDYRNTKEGMSTNTVGGEHKWDKLSASWRLNYTYTQDGRDTPVTMAFQSPSTFSLRPTIEYDFRNGDVNTVRLFQTGGLTAARTKGAQVTNIEDFQFPLQSAGMLKGGDFTGAYTAKADFDYESELFGRETKFEFGGLWTSRTKKSRESSFTRAYSGTGVPAWGQFATNIEYLGSQNLNYTFRYTNKDYTTNFVEDLVKTGQATRNDTRANYWRVGETITAGYAMATTRFDWGNIVYGARVEHIENEGQAFVNFPASGSTPAGQRLVKVASDDTLYYPSAHLNWNLREDLKLRVGVTTSASRADFDDLRPNFTFSDSNQTISGGNPDAKPERQVGLDTYLEWYAGRETFVSAGVFYKDLKDVLVQTSKVFGDTSLNSGGVDRSGYAYSSIGNAGEGHIKGLEVFFTGTAETFVQSRNLPAWLGGFGTRLSGTWTSSEVTLPSVGGVPARTISVLGTSDAVYNVQAIYEKYGLTMRLAYQYRTPWGQSVGAYRVVNGSVIPSDNGDIFWDSDEELDFSARYQVNNNIEVFFDASNLTNAGARRYGGQKQYPIEYEKFGPRYVAGVRFNF